MSGHGSGTTTDPKRSEIVTISKGSDDEITIDYTRSCEWVVRAWMMMMMILHNTLNRMSTEASFVHK